MPKKGGVPAAIIQFTAIILLAIGAYFLANFSREAVAGHRLRRLETQLESEVDRLEQEVAQLEKKQQEVKTDGYVEKVAREELRWVKPGDVLVVPQAENEPRTMPATGTESREAPQVRQEQRSYWRQWWNLFFDAAPPRLR